MHLNRPHRRRTHRDAGMTLPELLVAVAVSTLIVGALSAALSAFLRSAPAAELRLAESKDVTFLQTYVPADLRNAINSWDDPEDAAVKVAMLANTPSATYLANLPGTNVLTLLGSDADTNELRIISYRYEEVAPGEWRLTRYVVTNPGAGNESVGQVGVASEIASPPEGWVPADGVGHAVQVTARNQLAIRPVGEDLAVTFESGNNFRTGGAGLSAERDLTPNDPTTLPDPTAPPTRCGGRIAIVIDTSGSVPASGGGLATEDAAIGFIEAFIGTPTSISINGFDRSGYAMINNPALSEGDVSKYSQTGSRADFHSVLDGSDANVAMMIDRIRDLDDLDGAWPGGSASIDARDPNGDRIMWDQIGSGTNWEDGIYNIFFDASTGQPHNSYQPDLAVFITDGQPNWARTDDGGITSMSASDAAAEAAVVANDGRSLGSRLIGVFVGNKSTNSTYLSYFTGVVGSNAWDGSVNGDGTIDVGNAVAADYFTGSFADLGAVLRSIMIAECGGTLTVRKQLDDGSSPGGQWSYSTSTGGQVLDLSTQSSITFDFNFENGTIAQVVRLTEESKSGYEFVRGDCSVGGVPLDASRVVQQPDGVAGVEVTLQPDEAVSCVMVSEETS